MAETSEKLNFVGRRKVATARVSVNNGNGQITINGKDINEYFGRDVLKMILRQPLEMTGTDKILDVTVNVRGGGHAGQAGAIRHALSRVLCVYNPEFKPVLKKAGFLTRDARMKERKKYGQRAARARFQYSKR
ncbi:MAG: 30S ribosomal protein S9 [Deltaproteobacteria bacterium]|nr:30S ribosomal protein S9 [Deltaproteobacteria bacterium]